MHRNTESGSREHKLRKLDNTTKELKGWTFNPPSIILEKTKNHVQDRGTGPSACPLLSSPRHLASSQFGFYPQLSKLNFFCEPHSDLMKNHDSH